MLVFVAATLLSFLPATVAYGESALTNMVIYDEQGREIVPGGYVTITEDSKGTIHYTPDDYRRMVRMGANFQVIRTTLGKLGGWHGKGEDPAYLAQLDEMVRMGKEAGLRTIFKMVVYDIRPFGDAEWDAIYHNTGGAQDTLIAAWSKIWKRYKDEPSVFGYDLLNEPQHGLDPDNERCCREQLLPTLRRLADAMHAISPNKWALYQPLFCKDVGGGLNQFQPIREAFGRERVIYAPHLYSMDIAVMNQMLDRYLREAALSKAPLLIGEWGPSTTLDADTDPKKQQRYTQVYQATANAIDQHGVGAIKAWFCGTRSWHKSPKRNTLFTWAIFSDTNAVGHVERKYITDVLARPRPLAVAGHIERFNFDFATRTLDVKLQPDATHSNTEFFVSADRFYPEGFRIEVGTGLTLALKPGAQELSQLNSADVINRQQANQIKWKADSQHLVIKQWVLKSPTLTVKILPLKERP